VPRKRLPMRKINEVVRLKAAGLSIREIARSAGGARTTVYEYLLGAASAGLSRPLPDDALETELLPPATAGLAGGPPRAAPRSPRRAAAFVV
jgi:Helix-turn-helix domain of resolvase